MVDKVPFVGEIHPLPIEGREALCTGHCRLDNGRRGGGSAFRDIDTFPPISSAFVTSGERVSCLPTSNQANLTLGTAYIHAGMLEAEITAILQGDCYQEVQRP